MKAYRSTEAFQQCLDRCALIMMVLVDWSPTVAYRPTYAVKHVCLGQCALKLFSFDQSFLSVAYRPIYAVKHVCLGQCAYLVKICETVEKTVLSPYLFQQEESVWGIPGPLM